MAQTVFSTREIDTDSGSDSSGSGRLHFTPGRDNSAKKKTTRRRSTSHHLLMDAIEGGGSGEEEEKIPLPDYERLSQSMRLPGEDAAAEEEEEGEEPVKAAAAGLTQSASQGQKPIARKLMEKVFKKESDHHHKEKEKKEKEKDGEEKEKEKEKKKKKSSWLPDPEKRWPIQGWS